MNSSIIYYTEIKEILQLIKINEIKSSINTVDSNIIRIPDASKRDIGQAIEIEITSNLNKGGSAEKFTGWPNINVNRHFSAEPRIYVN